MNVLQMREHRSLLTLGGSYIIMGRIEGDEGGHHLVSLFHLGWRDDHYNNAKVLSYGTSPSRDCGLTKLVKALWRT